MTWWPRPDGDRWPVIPVDPLLTLPYKVLYLVAHMPTKRLAAITLATAIGLGALGDHLLRAPLWGLNVALGLIAVAGLGAALGHFAGASAGDATTRARWPWLAGGFFAAMWAVRDAPLLLAANLLAALALPCLPLVPDVTLRAAGVVETVAAPARAAWHAALGMFRLAPALPPLPAGTVAGTRTKAIGVGLLLAIPLVLVFGGLFASADPVFGAAVTSLISVDLGQLISHVFLTGALAWAIAGYLWALANPARGSAIPLRAPAMNGATVLTALAAITLVFTAFIATQAGSLFGGEAFIREQTGLTYAEYARRGFFQMLFAAALSLPLVYVAPFLADSPDARDTVSLRALMAVQLALTALVLASALWRIGLYVRAYGLTEDRLYGTAVLLWIAATIGVFVGTVLRSRPQAAAFGTVIAAVVTLAALNLINPAGFIARYNLEHQGRRGVDVAHLSRLGADAVPLLVSSVDDVAAEQRCSLVEALVKRHATARGDWRGWSLARARARDRIGTLESFVRSCAGDN